MNGISIFLIILGLILIVMGVLAWKWKQVTWIRPALIGIVLVFIRFQNHCLWQ
jgi:hypothetical protein